MQMTPEEIEEKRKRDKKREEEELFFLLMMLLGRGDGEDEEDLPPKFKAYLEKYNKAVDEYYDFKLKQAEILADTTKTEEEKKKALAGLKAPSTDWNALKRESYALAKDMAWEQGFLYVKLTGDNTPNTCEDCLKWNGQIICLDGSDPKYPSFDEFSKSHVFHPNCRHSLVPVYPETLVKTMNGEPLYTGFVYDAVDPLNTPEWQVLREKFNAEVPTYDFGETLVMISPFGSFKGWSAEGKAVDELIDEKAVDAIVESAKTEVLVDRDHASCKAPEERDTTAMAWASGFRKIKGLGALDGLYAVLKWTEEGRRLVESRAYRFLSPVWNLDKDNRPVNMISIGLTNRPAIKSAPILNTVPESEPQEEGVYDSIHRNNTNNVTKVKMNFLKDIFAKAGVSMSGDEPTEEEAALVMNTVASWKESADKEADKADRDAFDALMKDREVDDEQKAKLFDVWKSNKDGFALVLNACGMKKKEAQNTEADKAEEKPEDKTEDKPEAKPEPEEKEVIKKEALNTAPVIAPDASAPKSLKDQLMSLHGDEFVKFAQAHKAELREEFA